MAASAVPPDAEPIPAGAVNVNVLPETEFTIQFLLYAATLLAFIPTGEVLKLEGTAAVQVTVTVVPACVIVEIVHLAICCCAE